MSFINLGKDINEVKEPETVPEGMYDLTIEKVMDAKTDDDGNLKGINIIIDIAGELDAKAVFHHLSLPVEGDDDTKVDFKLRFIKKFLETFKIPFDKKGFDQANFPGATAKCKLVLDEYDGQVSNKLKL